MEPLLGAAVLVFTLLVAADAIGRRRGRALLRALPLTPTARRGLMAVLVAASAVMLLPALVPALRRGFFAFCSVCPLSPATFTGPEAPGGFTRAFLLGLWYYAATVLPVFVLACLLSGVVAAKAHRLPIRGFLPSFALAALLPVCSCGAVPLGRAMIDRGGSGLRDGLVFIATAPLLSPVILFLSITVLGPAYTIARIAGAILIAAAAATLVRAFVVQSGQPPKASAPVHRVQPGTGGSVFLAGWRYLIGLVRYALYGVVLGALFTTLIPSDYIASVVSRSVTSLAASVLVGVPINMCAGEEILVSGPLVGMGLSMGHAVAFALASTGICVASVPLLIAALGRRAVLAFVAVYLVIPFVVGLALNLLPVGALFGPRPF